MLGIAESEPDRRHRPDARKEAGLNFLSFISEELMSRRTVLALLNCTLLVSTVPLANAATKESSAAKTGQASTTKEPVAILELPASKELKFAAVTTPDLAIPLTIENQTTGLLKGVEVHGTDLHSPAGDVAAPEFDLKMPFDIAVGVPQTVKLKVRLLNAGTYTGTVTISQRTIPKDKKAQPPAPKTLFRFSIEIARTTAAPAIAISDIAAQEQTSSPWRAPLHVPLKMAMYATGAEVKVSRPFLDDVTVKPKADSASGSLVSNVKFDLQKVPDPITVVPGQPTPLELGIDGLASPGRYDGTIRFAPAGFQPVSKSFTIYVRDPFWVAIFFIVLGVALSLAVLMYGSTLRPRLLAQQRMTTILLMLRDESARAAGDADAEALVVGVRKNVMRRWDDAQKQRRAITTELDIFDQIVSALGHWTQLHKQVREVRPVEVRDELMPTLDDAAAVFGSPNPDATKVQSAISDVSALPQKIRTKIGEKLKKQVTDLTAKLAQYPHASVHEIAASVAAASEKLAHGDIEEAIGLVEGARLRYAIILADELIKRVSGPTTPPDGMNQNEWDALKRATTRAATIVSAAKDPDDATTRLFAAAVPYVLELSNAIEQSATVSIPDEAKRKPIIDAAEVAKTAVAQSVADGLNKLDAAAKLYEKAIASPGQTMGSIPLLASLAATALGAAPGGPSFDMIGSFGYGPPASDLDQPGAAKPIARQIGRYDIIVSVIVVVAACLIGLQVLWIDNPTWGGPANYLAAFVWGFAIDQFSHAGVAALRR